ncbi:leucine-rich repeat domain-containing protein [Amycolatopsis methanolica]|uniref:leucine-rich repeat domain-containing protein n=1 Tax=Amycolatopsis methanolica TaxID=1814 RepID=UPI003B833388
MPSDLSGLRELRELRLYRNDLHELPDSIGELSKLRELHLHGNHLAELPMSIGKLRDPRENELRTLPDGLAALPLVKLDLRWNRWLETPPWLDDRLVLR